MSLCSVMSLPPGIQVAVSSSSGSAPCCSSPSAHSPPDWTNLTWCHLGSALSSLWHHPLSAPPPLGSPHPLLIHQGDSAKQGCCGSINLKRTKFVLFPETFWCDFFQGSFGIFSPSRLKCLSACSILDRMCDWETACPLVPDHKAPPLSCHGDAAAATQRVPLSVCPSCWSWVCFSDTLPRCH